MRVSSYTYRAMSVFAPQLAEVSVLAPATYARTLGAEVSADDRERTWFTDTSRRVDKLDRVAVSARAARCVVLCHAGWASSHIAEVAGVTRMTVSNWIASTLEDDFDFDAWDVPGVTAPALDRRTLMNFRDEVGLTLANTRGAVPEELRTPLIAMWRIAARQRNSIVIEEDPAEELTKLSTSDALDALLLLLLRRGVTASSIARATEVTHRAVRDRLDRARLRGRVVSSDEEYFGEELLCAVNVIGSGWPTAEFVKDVHRAWDTRLPAVDDPATRWMAVTTMPAETDGCEITPNLMFRVVTSTAREHGGLKSRAFARTKSEWAADPETLAAFTQAHSSLRGLTADELFDPARWLSDELDVVRRLVIASGRYGDTLRDAELFFVPESRLYLSGRISPSLRVADNGTVSLDVLDWVLPVGLRDIFANKQTMLCFTDPDTVLAKYPPLLKHGDEAKTRRKYRTTVGRSTPPALDWPMSYEKMHEEFSKTYGDKKKFLADTAGSTLEVSA